MHTAAAMHSWSVRTILFWREKWIW
jgi:hypothetical protein